MNVTVNGDRLDVEPGATVEDLLARLGRQAGFGFALERNGRIVRRRDYAHTALEPGDRIELVTLVGGG